MLGLPRRSDSLRRTAAAGCGAPQWPIMHEKGTSSLTDPVSTSHGRVKETPLDCKRTLPPAHSYGVSARPPPPRRAPAGPTSPPRPRVGRDMETGRHVRNHRPRGARAASVAKKMCHSGFVGHKLPGRPPRARIAAETLAPGDPRHLVPDSRNRGAQRPGFRAAAPATAKTHKHHEQVRRPVPGPLVPEPPLRGRRRPAPRPRDNHRPRGGPRRLAPDVAPAPRRLPLIHDTSPRRF